jgi:hypothetical protein
MEVTTLIRVGDWVSGTSSLDEKFIGFVESTNNGGGLKVWVTQCDLESTVGTSIDAVLAKVKKLPDSSPETPDELRDLIELALMTHDQEWFQELSAKLSKPAFNTTPGKPFVGYNHTVTNPITNRLKN